MGIRDILRTLDAMIDIRVAVPDRPRRLRSTRPIYPELANIRYDPDSGNNEEEATGMTPKTAPTDILEIAYREAGSADGWPVILSHGFPYDVHAYDMVADFLAERGARVIVPWLRGYGPTRFRSPDTLRSGEQAALGADLLALMDALGIERAVLAGYDWGGRASCVVSALRPDRVRGLVSGLGYNVLDTTGSATPAPPALEHVLWYQYYLHGERGRAGLTQFRREFCRLLWEQWSPSWPFDDATFAATAAAYDNPDFVDVVVHSYRHRFGLAEGDPAYAEWEGRLAAKPSIPVPTIAISGSRGPGYGMADAPAARARFIARYEHRAIEGVGHNLPQEAPSDFADAVLTVAGWSS